MRLGLGSSLDNASWALDWVTAHGHPTALRPAIAAAATRSERDRERTIADQPAAKQKGRYPNMADP
jgi:hypothetical protein